MKILLSESLSESQRVNNLLFALHDYIQRVIKRKQKSCVTRQQIEDVALIIKRVENKSENLNRARNDARKTIQAASHLHSDHIEAIQSPRRAFLNDPSHSARARYSSVREKPQEYVNHERQFVSSDRRRAREDVALSTRSRDSVTCYACEKQKHIRLNCSNNQTRKAQNQ